MSKIDFSELEDILNSSINISLTEDQYKKNRQEYAQKRILSCS